MAVEIEIYEVDNGQIRIKHSFFGRTEREARQVMQKYAATHPDFMARVDADDDTAIEFVDEEVAIPSPEDFDEEE